MHACRLEVCRLVVHITSITTKLHTGKWLLSTHKINSKKKIDTVITNVAINHLRLCKLMALCTYTFMYMCDTVKL